MPLVIQVIGFDPRPIAFAQKPMASKPLAMGPDPDLLAFDDEPMPSGVQLIDIASEPTVLGQQAMGPGQ